jgi:hypothetical protein
MTTETPTRRGTSNRDARGSATARRARRAWLVKVFEANVTGMCRCYRCGVLLYNEDDYRTSYFAALAVPDGVWDGVQPRPLTVDRIIPGCRGGTYRRENIRPACGPCNSETGGSLRSHA